MNSRYKSVSVIRVRLTEEENNKIQQSAAHSPYKTTTAFIRRLIDEALDQYNTIESNSLKVLISKSHSIEESSLSNIRKSGEIFNELNIQATQTRINIRIKNINTNFEKSLNIASSIINEEICKLSDKNMLQFKDNVSTKKAGKLTKELNPSFFYYQIDVLNDLFAMSKMKSFSNFMRTLIMSLIENQCFTFHIESGNSAELRHQLSQINKNLIQTANKENVSAENKVRVQRLQMSIARLMIMIDSSKDFSMLYSKEADLTVEETIQALTA